MKKSSRNWYKKFDKYMLIIGFSKSKYNPYVYVKGSKTKNAFYLLLYIVDILVACKSKVETH